MAYICIQGDELKTNPTVGKMNDLNPEHLAQPDLIHVVHMVGGIFYDTTRSVQRNNN